MDSPVLATYGRTHSGEPPHLSAGLERAEREECEPIATDMTVPQATALRCPSVSIAMCTYNAERYLVPQLESFSAQTRLPAELVVQDDASADRTVEILREFARTAPFPVRVEENGARLGPTGNFEVSIGRCRSELIVLSDADDVWFPQRIEAMASAFTRDPRLVCVFSDAELMAEDSKPLGVTLWDSIGFASSDRERFLRGAVVDALFRRTIAFGGTMAFRREILAVALPIARPWGHDNWTGLVATALGHVTLIDRPLMHYRQHAAQYSGGRGMGIVQKLRARRGRQPHRDWAPRAGSFALLATRLRENRGSAVDTERLDLVAAHADAKDAHLRMREQLPSAVVRRVAPILLDALRLRYHRYSNGLASAARDLAFGAY